jgi:hypothetical protein
MFIVAYVNLDADDSHRISLHSTRAGAEAAVRDLVQEICTQAGVEMSSFNPKELREFLDYEPWPAPRIFYCEPDGGEGDYFDLEEQVPA